MPGRSGVMTALRASVWWAAAGCAACGPAETVPPEGPALPPRARPEVGAARDPAPGIVLSFEVHTLPAGAAARDAELWKWIDEDAAGYAQKTLLAVNGLRAGVVRSGGAEPLAKRLAELAVSESRRRDQSAADRAAVSLRLRRHPGRRINLFLHRLDGGLAARQYRSPTVAILLTAALDPTAPDRVRLEAVPEVYHLDEDAAEAGPRPEEFRDLSLAELLATLPSGREATEALKPAATTGRDVLDAVRLVADLPDGGTLLLAPTRDAGDPAGLGRLLLVDGPVDIGLETVVLVTARSGRPSAPPPAGP